jgi:hypothetical protein
MYFFLHREQTAFFTKTNRWILLIKMGPRNMSINSVEKSRIFYVIWSPRLADDIVSSTAMLLFVLAKVFRTFRQIALPSSSGSSSQRTAAVRADSVWYESSINYVTLQGGGAGVESFVTMCVVVGRGGFQIWWRHRGLNITSVILCRAGQNCHALVTAQTIR